MSDIAGWIAPIATMIAAMMTAANLGARVTGWGFVVFTVGSIGWIMVALTTGQTNLLLANGILTLVNLVGIWRWLGRQARFDDGARAAAERSVVAPVAALFPVGGIEGRVVVDPDGAEIARCVDAMAECETGRMSYLVVREGGIGGLSERLHALDWSRVTMRDDKLVS
jgi:hypothetical protein